MRICRNFITQLAPEPSTNVSNILELYEEVMLIYIHGLWIYLLSLYKSQEL